MIFTDALNEICNGKKVTREDWGSKKEYCLIQDDHLRIHTKGKFHDWILSYGDLLAEDWKVI